MFSTLDEAIEPPAADAAPTAHTPPTAEPSPLPSTAAPTETPVTYRLALYKPGSSVTWQGKSMTVSHVLLRRGRLLVYLDGHPDAVEPEAIVMPMTELVLQRTAER